MPGTGDDRSVTFTEACLSRQLEAILTSSRRHDLLSNPQEAPQVTSNAHWCHIVHSY